MYIYMIVNGIPTTNCEKQYRPLGVDYDPEFHYPQHLIPMPSSGGKLGFPSQHGV